MVFGGFAQDRAKAPLESVDDEAKEQAGEPSQQEPEPVEVKAAVPIGCRQEHSRQDAPIPTELPRRRRGRASWSATTIQTGRTICNTKIALSTCRGVTCSSPCLTWIIARKAKFKF